MEFAFGDGVPEELRQMLIKHHELHEMDHQAKTHEIKALLNSLDADQLYILRFIIRSAADSSENASYFGGLIVQLLDIKFGHCPCGEGHDPNTFLLQNQELQVDPDWIKEKLTEYGLISGPISPQVTCVNCGTQYVNLEDRMLKPPGTKGCEGCQNKARWG